MYALDDIAYMYSQTLSQQNRTASYQEVFFVGHISHMHSDQPLVEYTKFANTFQRSTWFLRCGLTRLGQVILRNGYAHSGSTLVQMCVDS
jgi:hypothetical protein